jgi:hypothetical protein
MSWLRAGLPTRFGASRAVRQGEIGLWETIVTDRAVDLADLDERIASVRENLRDLVERGAALSGAADEDLTDTRIAEQQAELQALLERRRKLAG